MTRRFSSRHCGSCLLLLMHLAVASSLVAQKKSDKYDRQTLGTNVTVNGNTISLEWSSVHPWNADLSRGGAALMAEYMTAAHGLVAETLNTARPSAPNFLAIRFQLPDALTAVPQGPVCLYIQTSNDRILPIRRAGPQGGDTARFRELAWESGIVSSTQASTHERRLVNLRMALSAAEEDEKTAQNNIAKSKISSPSACDQIPTPSFSVEKKPDDVLPLDQQEEAARRVCVSRVVWGQEMAAREIKVRRLDDVFVVVQPPDVSTSLLHFLETQPKASQENLQERRRQLTRLQADWNRWASSADDYNPPFGEKGDSLRIQDIDAKRAASFMKARPDGKLRIAIEEKPEPIFVAGYLGASLEAYSRCTIDGPKELKAKLDTWNEMQAKAPQLAAMARKELTDSCHAHFHDLASAQQQQKSLEDQLAVEIKIQPETGALHTAPTGVQQLNNVSCDAHAQAPTTR